MDKLLPGQNWGLILGATAALLGIYFLNTGLQYIVNYWGHVLGISIETEMRRKIFDHLQKLSFRFYDNQKTGRLVARVTKDLEEVGEVAHHGPEDAFVAVMTFLGSFGLMVSLNLKLALITGLVVPPMMWISTRYGRAMTQTMRTLFSRVGDFNARIEENVGGIRVVQAFANEDHERALFAGDNARYRETKLDAYRLMSKSMSLSYMTMRIVTLFVMIAGAYFVLHHALTVGGFMGFLLLVNVFFRPVEKINAVLESYPKGIAGFKRYTELLDTEPDIADAPGALDVGHLRGAIQFEGVTFGYDAHKTILRDIDLSIRPGETVAFVGPSGAGKTTLCSLLPRFYELDGGRITIDGVDIRRMTLASLRRNIGIVQQDVFLFAGTIRENIAYGRLGATDAEIWDAARRARLGDMIQSLPDGLDTLTGERGREAVRGPEAAHGDRAHVPEEPADPHSRRSHLRTRHRNRAGHPGIPRRTRRGPHDAGHRAPPGDHPERRPHRRRGRNRRRRAGPPRRTRSPPPASTAACTKRSIVRRKLLYPTVIIPFRGNRISRAERSGSQDWGRILGRLRRLNGTTGNPRSRTRDYRAMSEIRRQARARRAMLGLPEGDALPAQSIVAACLAATGLERHFLEPDDDLLAGAQAVLNTESRAIFQDESRLLAQRQFDAVHEFAHFWLHGGTCRCEANILDPARTGGSGRGRDEQGGRLLA